MLYVTTYYDNVKPCRRVGRLPTAGRGGYHPQVASSDRPSLVDGHGRMVGEAPPRGSVGSICPATKNAPPKGGAERLRKVIACRQNYPGQRIAYYAHLVAKRSCLPGHRQVSRKALLQRAARPNFFPSRRNTLSQTLQPFGTRCQPCRCLRSSPVPSVVSATESNPTQSVSPSSFLPPRCHPMVSMRRFPI